MVAAVALPRVRGLPVVGSSLSLLRDPLRTLRRAHLRHGPVFEVRAAHRRFVVLAGREVNRFVGGAGRDAFVSWSFWGRLADHRDCPHVLIAVDGPEHSTQRRLFGDTLGRRAVDEHRHGCVALVRSALDAVATGDTFEVSATTRRLVSRLVHHALTRGAPPPSEVTARSLMEVFRWESNTLLLGKWPRLALGLPAYRRHRAVTEAFLDDLIATDREAAPDDALDGWFARARRGRELHPELFTHGDLRMAYLLPFVAGVDTVGATLGFALYELARDPSLHDAVQREVRDAWPEHAAVPDSAALRALPLLHGLALECLRLHPSAFALYRRTTRGFSVAGREVPADRDVVVFTSATHFDPACFPDPERLDPLRHAPPRSESRPKHVFMPYGAGPHVCLGAGMGEALLVLSLATLLRDGLVRMPDRAPRHRPVFDPSLSVSPAFRLRRA